MGNILVLQYYRDKYNLLSRAYGHTAITMQKMNTKVLNPLAFDALCDKINAFRATLKNLCGLRKRLDLQAWVNQAQL